ncbi:MAG: PDGLE domain-containing protein [Nocardioides sp.]
MKTRTIVLVGVVVALLLAGVISFYASADPDGLNRVAQDKGFSRTESDHAAADGPFAGYATQGIDDGRLSGGVAGAVGTLLVLALAGGLTLVVRHRDGSGRRDARSSAGSTAGD